MEYANEKIPTDIDFRHNPQFPDPVIWQFFSSPPLPEDPDEFIEFDAMVSSDVIVPDDFKYYQEPIFHEMMQMKKNGTLHRPPSHEHIFHTISLSHVISPTQFYFTLEKQEETRLMMVDEMVFFFTKIPAGEVHPYGFEYLIPPKRIKIGMAVTAIFLDPVCPSPVIRGYVKEMAGEEKCVIFNVDRGTDDVVYKKNVHYLPKWLAKYPMYAYKGKLSGVFPFRGKDTAWTPEETAAFKKICIEVDPRTKAAVRYFTKGGAAVLYLRNHQEEHVRGWVDKEMVYRRFAISDTRTLDDIPDRMTSDDNDEVELFNEYFYDLSHPFYFEAYT